MTLIRVVVADDVALHRELLGKLLDRQPDISVVGEAASPEEAVAVTAALQPDVVLMDVGMPRHDPQGGITAIKEIAARHPTVKVLVLRGRPRRCGGIHRQERQGGADCRGGAHHPRWQRLARPQRHRLRPG